MGSESETPGIEGSAGRLGSAGSARLRLRVGIGRLSAGSESETPGIEGSAGRLGRLGSARLRLRVGIGRLTDGSGGMEHLLMIPSPAWTTDPLERAAVVWNRVRSVLPDPSQCAYVTATQLGTLSQAPQAHTQDQRRYQSRP